MQILDQLLDVAQSSAYEAINRVIKDLYQNAISLLDDTQVDESRGANAWAPSAAMQTDMNLYMDEGFDQLEQQTDIGLGFESLFNSFDTGDFIPH